MNYHYTSTLYRFCALGNAVGGLSVLSSWNGESISYVGLSLMGISTAAGLVALVGDLANDLHAIYKSQGKQKQLTIEINDEGYKTVEKLANQHETSVDDIFSRSINEFAATSRYWSEGKKVIIQVGDNQLDVSSLYGPNKKDAGNDQNSSITIGGVTIDITDPLNNNNNDNRRE